MGITLIEATSTVTTPNMEAVMGYATSAASLMGTVWTAVTGNPLLTLFGGAAVLGVGFGIFKHAKRAAR